MKVKLINMPVKCFNDPRLKTVIFHFNFFQSPPLHPFLQLFFPVNKCLTKGLFSLELFRNQNMHTIDNVCFPNSDFNNFSLGL